MLKYFEETCEESGNGHLIHAHHPATLKILNLPQRLSDEEQKQLAACEAIIATGWNTFVEVGRALATVQKQRLYRDEHRTFVEYCRRKWQYGKSHAYRLIGAAQVIENLSPIGDMYLPTHEAQVRALIGLSPNQARTVWTRAVQNAERKQVTSKHVREAVIEVLGTKSKERRPQNPSNGKVTILPKQLQPALDLVTQIEESLCKHPTSANKALKLARALRSYLKGLGCQAVTVSNTD